MNRTVITLVLSLFLVSGDFLAQSGNSSPSPKSAKEKVIIDTDIGDDIDDAFAVGLALNSPELDILGFTTAWGNTKLRARLLDRLLRETGHNEIPVAVGIERYKKNAATFSQAPWASREPEKSHQDAVTFLLDQINKYPGEITLIAIGPETNLGAAIERDRATFTRLKRIVLMAGSVRLGYDERAPILASPPIPEYNIVTDIPAAQAVFTSGVPLYVMPLDSTQLKLEERKREMIFTRSTPLTDAMTLLYHLWSRETKQVTPTMFDTVAVAYAIAPQQCPVTPLHIEVDTEGYTREKPGNPNSYVCLKSNSDTFFRFYLPRVLAETQPASLQ
jgi:purine nucleosidase